jgi:glycine hydroxymethyltransferase
LAIDRARQLFGAKFANVQPHSGAQANQAVFLALLQPGDRIMGMSLAHGGHLTHGSPVTMSGKWFDVVSYEVRESDQLIDYDAVRALALETRPKLILAGASAYPRVIDFAAFREIADLVGAYLMVDMAHYAGLVATGHYPDPLRHAHVVTTTTHKTLRGPRGGMILTNDEALAKKLNSAVFPGNQGGPLMHVIAAKAVAFGEALRPEFEDYAGQVIKNAKALSQTLIDGGLAIVSGGTDCHMVLVDLRPKGVKGRDAEQALERAGLTCNKNAIPFDPEKPAVTSGVRLGTAAGTTRGFAEAEFRRVGELILKVVDALAAKGPEGDASIERDVLAEVRRLCALFPIYR